MSIDGVSKRIDFNVVGSYAAHHDTPKICAERTINMYEVVDDNAKKPRYLALTPGLNWVQNLDNTTNQVRASIVHYNLSATQNYAYFVVGSNVYRADQSLSLTTLPFTLATSTGFVGIAVLADFICFTDQVNTIIYRVSAGTYKDVTSALQSIVPGFIAADVTSMDGYFIFVDKNSSSWVVSELNLADYPKVPGDPGTPPSMFPLTYFAQVNSYPVLLQGCARLKRRLFLFGNYASEVWLDAGASDFPFRRDNNILLEHGLAAPGSLVEGFDRLFYLSQDINGIGSIMMVEGVLPEPISTYEMDKLFQSFITVKDAVGMVYRINGQVFYHITFPSGVDENGNVTGRTFIYNVKTGRFHEMEMMDRTYHVASCHVYFFYNADMQYHHFVGSFKGPFLLDLNPDAFTNQTSQNAVENIRRTRICHIFNSPTYERIRIDRLQLDMVQGALVVGNYPDEPGDPDDANPAVHLFISEDGGVHYHFYGFAPIGRAGEFITRTIWRRLGVRRDATIKFEIYNVVKTAILGGAIDMEVLPE